MTCESSNGTYDEEVNRILKKLEGHTIPHVEEDSERRSAVERTVNAVKISSELSIEDLLLIISTNEEQLGVHSAPSDPQEDQQQGFVRSQD